MRAQKVDSVQLGVRLLDVLAVVTIVPLAVAAGLMVRAAWRGYHPPRKPVRQNPASFGLEAERVAVAGADGCEIACWFVPAAAPSDAVVVLGHGIGRDSSMLMPLAAVLHAAGYHVLTFDLRNHGDNADDGLLRGQSPRYEIDHHAVVRYVRDRPDLGDVRVACLGFSMSSWTAIAVARREPDLVRAVVCDSGPTVDIPATIGRMFDATRGRLPRFMRGPLMAAAARRVFVRAALFFLKPAPWPLELDDHSIRMLFIGGEADPVARPDDLREMLEWYPQAELWLVPRAGHMQAHTLAAAEYEKRVLAVLDEALRPRDA